MALPTPSDPNPEIKSPKSNIDTPAVIADLDLINQHIQEFASLAEQNNVGLRPHIKAHKIPDLAHRQTKPSPCRGVLCQTIGEVEVMSQNGISDIFLSNIVISKNKIQRLVQLSEKLDHFATTIDGPANMDPLQDVANKCNATISVYLEIDIGLERVGVPPGEKPIELAKTINDMPNLRLEGILAHDPHFAFEAESDDHLRELCFNALDEVQRTLNQARGEGYQIGEVISGCTATAKHVVKHPVVTQIDPGRYLFNDAGQIKLGRVDKADCALSILTTVVSKTSPDRVCVDAGFKSFGLDVGSLLPVPKHRDDISYYHGYSEHGMVDVSDSEEKVQVGDRIEFIVPDAHATMNINDTLIGIRDSSVNEVWQVQARGKTR